MTPAETTLKASFDSLAAEYETLWEFFSNDPANKETADYLTQMFEGNFMNQDEFITLRGEYTVPYDKILELTQNSDDFDKNTHTY